MELIEKSSDQTNLSTDGTSQITHSKYFSSAFNSAIFDGPVRIYFTQYQEAEALKIYFAVQDKIKENNYAFRNRLKRENQQVFILLYPTADIYNRSFSENSTNIASAWLERDLILGLNGVLPDSNYEIVVDYLSKFFDLDN